MIKQKKIFSFILAMIFLITCLPAGARASMDRKAPQRQEVVNGRQEGDKLVFRVLEAKNKKPAKKIRKRRSLATRAMSLFGLDVSENLNSPGVGSSQTISQKVNVTLDAKGLNYGDNMSTNLIPDGLKVKLNFARTGQSDKIVASKEITVPKSGAAQAELDIPADISTGVLYAEIQNPDDNVNIRIVKGGDATVDTQVDADSTWDFTFEVIEIVHPLIKLEAKDPYGQDASVTDNLSVKFKNKDLEVPFELSTAKSEYNIKNNPMFAEGGEGDINELNNYDENNKPSLTVDNATGNETDGYKVTLGETDYKVEKKYDYQTGGLITLTSLPDAMVPPKKDDGTPVSTPEGYVRLTFDANEKVEPGKTGITGKHTVGTYTGQQKSYIDVKSGTKYGNANLQKLIKALKVQGSNNEEQNSENPWEPKVPTDQTEVTKTTYNAKYIKTADKIKKLGGLKGVDFGVWKDTSTAGDFWKKGVVANTTDTDKKAKIDDALAGAKVEDTTATPRSTNKKGAYPGTLKVTFKDGSVYVANEQGATEAKKTNIAQTLHVYDKGDTKPDPGTGGEEKPVPAGTIFVEFTRDKTSIKEDEFKDLKPLMYAENDTVPEGKFPDAQPETGYKTVIWTPAKDTALSKTNQAYKEETKTFTFKASATKKNAKQLIEDAGGLKPVDISIWSGDAIKWSKGVAINYDTSKTFTDEEKNALEDLLKKRQ